MITDACHVHTNVQVSQKFGGDLTQSQKKGYGGDEDLPVREALNERRLKYDAAAARRAVRAGGGGGDSDEYDAGT